MRVLSLCLRGSAFSFGWIEAEGRRILISLGGFGSSFKFHHIHACWSTGQLLCLQQMEAKGQTMKCVLPALTHHLALLLQPCCGGIARERSRQKVCLALSLLYVQRGESSCLYKGCWLFFQSGTFFNVHFSTNKVAGVFALYLHPRLRKVEIPVQHSCSFFICVITPRW